MKSNFIKSFRSNKNLKTYIVFLFFTTFIWVLLQFSKNHSQVIVFDIEYTDVNQNVNISNKSTSKIKLNIIGNGFKFLYYSLLNKKLQINSKRIINKHAFSNFNYLEGDDLKQYLKSRYFNDSEINFMGNDSIKIYYEQLIEKELPVKLKSDISYASGYKSIKGLSSKEIKLKVKSTKTFLDTLKFIESKVLKLNNVSEGYSGKLELINPSPKNLTLSLNKIDVFLNVDKVTEGSLLVPITVLNTPESSKIQLFPKEIKIVFGVLVKDYKRVMENKNQFKVTADFKSIKSNKLIPKITTTPENVFNSRLTQKEVEYILIQ